MKDGLQIEGTEGSLVVDLWSDELVRGYAENGNPKTEIIPIELTDAWDDAFEGEHRAFATAMTSGKLDDSAGSGEDGRLTQSIVEAIYASDKQCREIQM